MPGVASCERARDGTRADDSDLHADANPHREVGVPAVLPLALPIGG
jgi:hypothetical protein